MKWRDGGLSGCDPHHLSYRVKRQEVAYDAGKDSDDVELQCAQGAVLTVGEAEKALAVWIPKRLAMLDDDPGTLIAIGGRISFDDWEVSRMVDIEIEVMTNWASGKWGGEAAKHRTQLALDQAEVCGRQDFHGGRTDVPDRFKNIQELENAWQKGHFDEEASHLGAPLSITPTCKNNPNTSVDCGHAPTKKGKCDVCGRRGPRL